MKQIKYTASNKPISFEHNGRYNCIFGFRIFQSKPNQNQSPVAFCYCKEDAEKLMKAFEECNPLHTVKAVPDVSFLSDDEFELLLTS